MHTRTWLYALAVLAAACGDDTKPAVNLTANATTGATAQATLSAAVSGSKLSGSATFRTTSGGVDLELRFLGCVAPDYYAVQLFDTPDCQTALSPDKQPLDAKITDVTCSGTTGNGFLFYTRAQSDAQPWRIGTEGSGESLVGRALVLRSLVNPTAAACGVITQTAAGTAEPPPSASALTLPLAAELAGICTWRKLLPNGSETCPDAQRLVDCMSAHCGLGNCAEPCAEHIACLQAQPPQEMCAATEPGAACEQTGTCQQCTSALPMCFSGFCLDTLTCDSAKATPGGPCDKVNKCCKQQGNYERSCLQILDTIMNIGGDINCISVMSDWDFNTHIPVPCDWDALRVKRVSRVTAHTCKRYQLA